ncbi:ABC transporter permease [Agathobaculum sp. NTUH-O15-33]|uniref:ABC transporter permease n=1 Tax=Agathobaculum sp. NTUH-O15-33 TaxID=3079302 RepID=UPI00295864E2|nr:ABC transporter permease [Agathobaculum sp. NTUH-O15-33]WNX86060.1 ABC transporter permease [Agathobaculum sp. NTUH-O15-33]
MNIFHKVALQSMRKSRTRTIVTVIGVILSAAMLTAVTTFGVSLLHYMVNGAAQKYGGWHAAFLDVDPAFAQERAQDDAVASAAAFENIGYAALEGGQNPEKPYLFVAGFSGEAWSALPIRLVSGRLPENGGEILVPSHVAANGGVKIAVGDTLTLAVGKRTAGEAALSQHDPYRAGAEQLRPTAEKTYTVVGICERPTFEERSAPGYTLITTAAAEDEADSLSLYVTLQKPRQVHAYVASAAGGRTVVLNEELLRFMGLSDDTLFNTLLYAVGGIVIAIIMLGSIFLIYNAFSISLNERTQQIGILSSVGATAGQLRGSVLFEGLCIGAVGIPIGVAAGIAGMGVVIAAVSKNFKDILYAGVSLTLTVSLPAILLAAAVSLATILISAYLPAKRVARMPVMDCIRQTNEVKVRAGDVKISGLAQRLYGLEGSLALKNFKRNKKRYRSIVLSLVLSVVLFVTTSSFVMDLKQASEQAIVFTTYDIGFGTIDMEDGPMLALYDRLKNVQGVQESGYQVCVDYTCTVPADRLTDAYWQTVGGYAPDEEVKLQMMVQFLDDGSYLAMVRELGLPTDEYTGPNAKLLAVAKMDLENNRLHEVTEFADLFQGSEMDAAITPKASGETEQAQPVRMTLVEAVVPDIPPMTVGTYEKQPYIFQVLAPWSLQDRLAPAGGFPEIRAKGMTFRSQTPAASTAAMKAIVEDAGVTAAYNLMNMQQALSESRNYIFIANVFAYTFIVMISLITAANVFNTISTNLKLRRRELAMLRSVGMSDRSFNRMMRVECAFYGARALLIGLPVAALCSWLIYKGMFIGGADHIEFVLPWASIGISVCSVLLIIWITMVYAVGKLKKENIIDALRDDMT